MRDAPDPGRCSPLLLADAWRAWRAASCWAAHRAGAPGSAALVLCVAPTARGQSVLQPSDAHCMYGPLTAATQKLTEDLMKTFMDAKSSGFVTVVRARSPDSEPPVAEHGKDMFVIKPRGSGTQARSACMSRYFRRIAGMPETAYEALRACCVVCAKNKNKMLTSCLFVS